MKKKKPRERDIRRRDRIRGLFSFIHSMAHRFDVFRSDGTPSCSQCGKSETYLDAKKVEGKLPLCSGAVLPVNPPPGKSTLF